MKDIQNPTIANETSPLLEHLTLIYQKAATLRFSPSNLSILAALESKNLDLQMEASIELHKLGDGLNELITQDARFFGDSPLYIKTDNGSRGFYPNFVSDPLIRHALLTNSPEDAILWLQKVLNTTTAHGTVSYVLWGAPVEETIFLTDKIKITPIEELPESTNKERVTQNSSFDAGVPFNILSFTPPQSALVMTKTIEPFIVNSDWDHSSTHIEYSQTNDLLNEIALVLTALGPRVVVSSAQWFAFDDPELEKAQVFSGRSTQTLEIMPYRPSNEPPLDVAETQAIVRAYLELQGETRAKIRVALQRLSQALRRHNVGDRAVELSTALETLLGDSGTSEMTHKIKVRSVRLIGGSNETRIRNAAIINKTYSVRSKLVHTGVVNASKEETICGKRLAISDIVDEAIRICTEIIKIIIIRGDVPDWSVFDITEKA